MTKHTQLFSKPLGGFSFRLLVGETVVGLLCPESGKRSPEGRTAEDFTFRISDSPIAQPITVRASDTFIASHYEDVDRESVILRAAAKALKEEKSFIEIHTGNFTEFCSDASLTASSSQLRRNILDYIVDRYEIEFESPFTVIELFASIPSDLEPLLKQLRYLDKHGYVTLAKRAGTWGREVTQDLRDELVRTLSVTNENFEKLQNAKSDRRVLKNEGVTHTGSQEWDFFICHASEDKHDVVDPLATELKGRGCKVWLDEWTLSIGDSLSQKIDQGLARSKYGIVVLSRSFFKKDWPKRELSGLVQKEIGGKKVILPVWHDVGYEDVKRFSPTLVDRVAAKTQDGIACVADKLVNVLTNESEVPPTSVQTSRPQVADILIGRKDIEIHDALHIYGLAVMVRLNRPPEQGRLRLKIRWPSVVPISKTAGIRQVSRNIADGHIESYNFILDWEQRVFPGEQVYLLGKDPEYCFEYKFTDTVWKAVYDKNYMVEYTLHFEDHDPISGLKPINELHVY